MHLDLSRTAGIVIQILLSQMTKKYLLKLTPLKLFRCPAVILLSVDEPLFTNLLESNWIHFDKMFWKQDEEQFFVKWEQGTKCQSCYQCTLSKFIRKRKWLPQQWRQRKLLPMWFETRKDISCVVKLNFAMSYQYWIRIAENFYLICVDVNQFSERTLLLIWKMI